MSATRCHERNFSCIITIINSAKIELQSRTPSRDAAMPIRLGGEDKHISQMKVSKFHKPSHRKKVRGSWEDLNRKNREKMGLFMLFESHFPSFSQLAD